MPKTAKHSPEITKRIRDLNTAATKAKKASNKTFKSHYRVLSRLLRGDIDSVWDDLNDRAQELLADKRKRPIDRPAKTAA